MTKRRKLTRKQKIQADKICRTWRSLNQYIKHLSVDQVEYALESEKMRLHPRATVKRRLTQRLVSLRAQEIRSAG